MRIAFSCPNKAYLDAALDALPGVDIDAVPIAASNHPETCAVTIYETLAFTQVADFNDSPNLDPLIQLDRFGLIRFVSAHAGSRGVVSLNLTFNDGQNDPIQLTREIPGRVVDRYPTDGGKSWESIWIPDGYSRTFSELSAARFTLDKRRRLLFDLADHLGLPSSRSIYEAHITVECESRPAFDSLRKLCDQLGFKAIQIELPAGVVPEQVITASFHRGPLEAVRREVEYLAEALRVGGYPPLRFKIEAMLKNPLVPESDEAAVRRPQSEYFEFHVKVAIDPFPEAVSLQLLGEVCGRHGAHLSRNASNRLRDGVQHRFATMRAYHCGRCRAEVAFDRFLADLRVEGFYLSNVLREYTVLDTNLLLDEGWFDEPGSQLCESCEALAAGDCPFADAKC